MHLAIQALTAASLQACHWNKWNISNKRWKSQLAGGRPVGYTQSVIKIWTRDYWETNPACGRVEVLTDPGPPDYNSNALTLPPHGRLNFSLFIFLTGFMLYVKRSHLKDVPWLPCQTSVKYMCFSRYTLHSLFEYLLGVVLDRFCGHFAI